LFKTFGLSSGEFSEELGKRIEGYVLRHRCTVRKYILGQGKRGKGIEIVAGSNAVKWLADKGYDKKMGARPLARLIDNKIKSPLSRRVLFGDLVDGGRVNVGLDGDELTFTVTEIPKPLTKEERKALKAARALELQQATETADDRIENQDNQ
jgi:ATP-dependent Clp protease ATP-binding subunit ClpA